MMAPKMTGKNEAEMDSETLGTSREYKSSVHSHSQGTQQPEHPGHHLPIEVPKILQQELSSCFESTY